MNYQFITKRQSVAILVFLICITDKNSFFIQIYKEIRRIAKEIWKNKYQEKFQCYLFSDTHINQYCIVHKFKKYVSSSLSI